MTLLNDRRKLSEIQAFLQQEKLDGWLLYDFRQANKPALRILNPSGLLTRRWFVLIPARGEVRALIHGIETAQFEHLRCPKAIYVSWQSLEKELRALLAGQRQVAMEYSPNGAIPTISRVDGGMLEWIRSFGVTVHSSADLIQFFLSRVSQRSLELHREATRQLLETCAHGVQVVRQALATGRRLDEYELQQILWQEMQQRGLEAESAPIVAVQQHSGDPHYFPVKGQAAAIEKDKVLLLDFWGKKRDQEEAIFSDITWMYYTGPKVPPALAADFAAVAGARDAAVEFLKQRLSRGEEVRGYEVDDAARGYLKARGLDALFIHRTGHSIDAEDHGSGVNLDNLETRDERKLIPEICFSVEPGLYRPEYGVRSEINVYVGERQMRVLTPLQKAVEVLF